MVMAWLCGMVVEEGDGLCSDREARIVEGPFNGRHRAIRGSFIECNCSTIPPHPRSEEAGHGK